MRSGTSKIPAPAPAQPGAGGGVVRPEVPISDPPAPRGRRRSFMIAGCVMVLVGAVGVAGLLNAASDRTDVLALARNVPVGQEITSGDLKVVALPEDPALKPVPAGDKGKVVGRRAAVGLSAGSLLVQGQVADGNALRAAEALVAVEVKRGAAPIEALTPGDTVRIVSTPDPAASVTKPQSAGPDQTTGRVVKVGQADLNGSTVVHVAVPDTDAATVASRAAAGKVALVLAAKG